MRLIGPHYAPVLVNGPAFPVIRYFHYFQQTVAVQIGNGRRGFDGGSQVHSPYLFALVIDAVKVPACIPYDHLPQFIDVQIGESRRGHGARGHGKMPVLVPGGTIETVQVVALLRDHYHLVLPVLIEVPDGWRRIGGRWGKNRFFP